MNFTDYMRRDDAKTLRRYIHELQQIGIQVPLRVLLAAGRGNPDVEQLRSNLLAAGCDDSRAPDISEENAA